MPAEVGHLRERLLEDGAGKFTETDLLRLLLPENSRGPPIRPESLFKAIGGFPGLNRAPPELLRRLGLTPSQAAATVAAAEIGRRLAYATVPQSNPLHPTPQRLAEFLSLRYGAYDQEIMGAVFLDRGGRMLGHEAFFRGTLNRCFVEPAPILRAALLQRAHAVLVFHTHPSGDPTPSGEDVVLTRRLERACRVIGIVFVDHLVVAPGGKWMSFRARGW